MKPPDSPPCVLRVLQPSAAQPRRQSVRRRRRHLPRLSAAAVHRVFSISSLGFVFVGSSRPKRRCREAGVAAPQLKSESPGAGWFCRRLLCLFSAGNRKPTQGFARFWFRTSRTRGSRVPNSSEPFLLAFLPLSSIVFGRFRRRLVIPRRLSDRLGSNHCKLEYPLPKDRSSALFEVIITRLAWNRVRWWALLNSCSKMMIASALGRTNHIGMICLLHSKHPFHVQYNTARFNNAMIFQRLPTRIFKGSGHPYAGRMGFNNAAFRRDNQQLSFNDEWPQEPFFLSLIKDTFWGLRSLLIFLAEQPSQLKYIEWPSFQSTLKTATLALVLVALLIVTLSSVDSALSYILTLILRRTS